MEGFNKHGVPLVRWQAEHATHFNYEVQQRQRVMLNSGDHRSAPVRGDERRDPLYQNKQS